MSDHLNFDYQCPSCEEHYIPFRQDARNCPKCGYRSDIIGPSVEKIVDIAKMNINFVCLSVTSLGDFYMSLAVDMLDYVKSYPTTIKDIDEITDGFLDFFETYGEYNENHYRMFLRDVIIEAFQGG